MLEAASVPGVLVEQIGIRFGVTVVANVLRAGLSFATGILIARDLGASRYGDLNFLLGSFVAISLLLEMGTSSAFYTFISRRRRGATFFALYIGWLVFQFAGTVLVVGLLLPRSVVERVWVGHERGIVLLAFVASFLMMQAWGMVSQLGEAVRKTVIVQVALVIQAAAHLALILAASYWGWLTVKNVMWLLVGEYALFVAALGPRLVRANLPAHYEGRDNAGTVAKEFTTYCAPLVIYGWVGFLYAFADRWLLQQFGGAEQQGFFAVGQQFANVSLIVTASILRVFWKEVAEARERQDHRRVQRLYVSVSRGLYFVGAWISCLLLPYSREILSWTLGPSYEAAWLILGLMFLVPIHQSLGQIVGTFLYADGETWRYAKIGVLTMGVSIPVTYLMLASPSAAVPGLGLAAVGLALKMVVLQVVGVNLYSRLIAKANGWTWDYGHQAAAVGILFGVALLSKWVAGEALGLAGVFGWGHLATMGLGWVLYATSTLIILYKLPWLAGLGRDQIRFVLSSAGRRLGILSAVSR